MHWIFYVVAAAVTALAIYVQMKRVDKGTKDLTKAEEEPSSKERKKKRSARR